MKILLIGDFSKDYDEGLKNIAKYFYKYLSGKHEVATLNIKKLISINSLSDLKLQEPDIIHYFTVPTLNSLILLKVLSLRWRNSKIIISALHPQISNVLKLGFFRSIISRLFKPNVILYQAHKVIFQDISDQAFYMPNGVDVHRFRPSDNNDKMRLRVKYSIEKDKFIILHVGHLTKQRNLELLKLIQRSNDRYRVLIIGGTYLSRDDKIVSNLNNNGCKVIIGYQENIEEFYRLSDCYVFPVKWGNTISMPLSVLEAMSCNLPVVMFKYDTFSSFLEGGGVFFADNEQHFIENIKEIECYVRNNNIITNREKVIEYSWENIIRKVENIYDHML